MTGFSKFLLCAFAALSLVVAQEKVQISIPIEGGDKYDIAFDLAQVGDITNAARQFCIQKASELGITTQEQLTTVCVPRVEEFMIASLLANKVLTNKAPSNSVSMTIVVDSGESFQISFDPAKSTPAELAEYFCVEKQKELKVTTQDQLDNVCIPAVTEYIARRLQPVVKSAAPQQLNSAAVQTKTIPADMRTITIPVENIGDIAINVDINAVTANQAADFVCQKYAKDLNLQTTNEVNERCIPPISTYIQNLFSTSTKPNIQSMNMKVDGKDVEFSFDVNKVSVDGAAESVCLQKRADFDLVTDEDVVKKCVPPVAEFISETLRARKLIR